MKTSFKRFAALALAAIMVLATMNMTAMADPAGSTGLVGNRTLDNQLVISGLAKGDIVRFYQVFAEDEDATETGGWVYTSAFAPMSTSEGISVSQITGNPAGSPAVSMGLTSAIAGKIARLTVNETPDMTLVVADGETSVTWDASSVDAVSNTVKGAPAGGMYVAIITANDVDTVYNPVFVSADYVSTNPSASWNIVTSSSTYSDNAAAKKSTLKIDKSADTVEDKWDDEKVTFTGTAQGAQYSEYTTAIGDSVSFTVDTTIPGFGGVYEYPSFVIEDSMTDLAYQTGTAVVYLVDASDQETPLDSSKYDTYPESSAGYTITFDQAYLKTLAAPQKIRVRYSAIVTTDALKNVNFENNTVEIKYTHNPSDSSDLAVKKDETNHFTFSIDAASLFGEGDIVGKSGSEFVKVGVGPDNKPITSTQVHSEIIDSHYVEGPLQGATFRLYTSTPCTSATEYKPKDKTGTIATSGVLYTTDAAGKFTITGLDSGVYYLKEESAPRGFIKHQEPVKIEIQKTIAIEDVTQWYFGGKWYETKDKADQAAAGAGYDATTKPTAAELVKKYTYQTDVLKSYKILIGGQEAASHTFMHSSSNSEIKWVSSSSTETPASIVNTQGVELPSTGGIGTTIFYMGGAVLVLLAGVLLVSKRRMA